MSLAKLHCIYDKGCYYSVFLSGPYARCEPILWRVTPRKLLGNRATFRGLVAVPRRLSHAGQFTTMQPPADIDLTQVAFGTNGDGGITNDTEAKNYFGTDFRGLSKVKEGNGLLMGGHDDG